jgi:uncharacterized protein
MPLSKRLLAAAALAVALFAIVPPAVAFNCAVPALVNVAKRTVCKDPILAALNLHEQERLAVVRSVIAVQNRGQVINDRRIFLRTRDNCRSDVRCLDATYRAQVRLYSRLEACGATIQNQAFCLTRAIQRHRQELHRSL